MALELGMVGTYFRGNIRLPTLSDLVEVQVWLEDTDRNGYEIKSIKQGRVYIGSGPDVPTTNKFVFTRAEHGTDGIFRTYLLHPTATNDLHAKCELELYDGTTFTKVCPIETEELSDATLSPNPR